MAVIRRQQAVGHIRSITIDVVAEHDGSVQIVGVPAVEGALLALRTTPGTPAPSEGYDVQLVNILALDCLHGCGLHRSSTATERVMVRFPGEAVHPVIDEADCAHLQITGNRVPFAVFTITIVFGLTASE